MFVLEDTPNAALSSAEAIYGRGKWFGSSRQCVAQWEERKGRSLFLVSSLTQASKLQAFIYDQGSRKEASAEEKL